jgi:signal peptidase complex subunit 3
MHSTWIRLNAVVFFSISLLGIAALMASWSTYFHRSHPVVTRFEFNQLRELKPTMSKQPGTRDIDRADITFDLECDLSSVFNWCVRGAVRCAVQCETAARCELSATRFSIDHLAVCVVCMRACRNVKQLFVMVTAEYATKSNKLNQVVIWDQIVERPEDAVLR